ncbi:MAG: hypothetical protein ACRDQD_31960 [Nocardioidaceae bacterium]
MRSPVARTAYDRLSCGRKREHVLQEHDLVDLPVAEGGGEWLT